ncbi:hypothetical protein [Carnimonas nigrificans]|uniref:hypothetical protein n=1 Tax=Carnimonas nigrificans TaxID=64323 RepID=UPI00046F039C|nr:hypothetical protein [Carnimonas nigrificans]
MKHLGLSIIGLLSVCVLSACGGSEWVKPDATSQDKSSDTAQCQVMQKQADNDETFDNCMAGKGWVKK